MNFKMSDEQKEKATSIALAIYRSASFIALGTILINIGVWKNDVEKRIFDSPAELEKVRQVANDHMTEIEVYKEILRITRLEQEQTVMKQDIKAIKDSQARIEKKLLEK